MLARFANRFVAPISYKFTDIVLCVVHRYLLAALWPSAKAYASSCDLHLGVAFLAGEVFDFPLRRLATPMGSRS